MARGGRVGSHPGGGSVGRNGQGRGRKSGGRSAKGGKNVGGKSGKGPRLSNWLLKEIGVTGEKQNSDSEGLEDEVGGDVYEYEEEVPQEEQGKNKRFDDIERMEYEFPSDFEDEEIDEDEGSVGEDNEESEDEESNRGNLSDRKKKEISLHSDDEDDEGSDGDDEEEEEEEEDDDEGKHGEMSLDSSEDEEDEDDDERHQRLLEAVTGKSSRPEREGKTRKEQVTTEAYPESEFNLNPNADGSAPITVEDLINPLHNATGFGALRKRMQELRKKSAPVKAPLPKYVQDRVNRQAGYRQTNKDVTEWVPIVKRNREAPTLVLNKREEVPALSTATLAATFKATTDFEKEISQLFNKSKLGETKHVEEAENLELNKLTVEEVRERQTRLAKMRNLLFRHELKAKRVKKIKSKTYHRLMNKVEKARADYDMALSEADPEAAKAAAIKQEFLRAQERMTLKHKNQSRWAKRILKRGLKSQENDGTRDAIADQLRTHALLTRKIHSATLSSSEDDDLGSSSDGEAPDDDEPTGLVLEKPNTRVLARAKVAILKAIEEGEEDQLPKTGVFAIPFMARALEKKKKAAEMEAMAALEQLEQAEAGGDVLALHDDYNKLENAEKNETTLHGKMSFGDAKRPLENIERKFRSSGEELSDQVDDSDEERERSMAGGVDMGEVALQVTKRTNITVDVSTSKQSEDLPQDGYAFDFLDSLDRRASYSVGMEDVDPPAKAQEVERPSRASSYVDTKEVDAPTAKAQDVERPSNVDEALKSAGETERLASDVPATSGPDERAVAHRGRIASNDIAARRLEKRKKRKFLRKNNGIEPTSIDEKQVPTAENGALHDDKRRKVHLTHDETLPNNGASTSDGKDAPLEAETGNEHRSKRGKRKSRNRSRIETVTSTMEPATSNGPQDKPVEKVVVGTAPLGTEAENGQTSKRSKRKSNRRSKIEGVNSSVEPATSSGPQDSSVEKIVASIALLETEIENGQNSRRSIRIADRRGRIEAVTSSVEPARSSGPQDGAVEKIAVSIAGRPKSKSTTSSVLHPIKVETPAEISGQQDEQVPSLETNGNVETSVAAATAISFSDDEDSDHAQEMELPSDLMSQQALIRQAFAGDDVEAEFEQIKSQALDSEVPQGEAPVTLPGWGQWAHIQQKRGQPAWIQREQERLKKSRDDALGKRKDAKLRHVIISEKVDKKASKFHAPTVPFPFNSKEVYERSVRMPIGREFNTDKAFRDMIRPTVIKSAGQIIDPIKREVSSAKGKADHQEPKRKRGKK
ncbi:hypothetical protein R1flu_028412 [Riccia fluitans]|uniref:U3 small nucleolar RNA-associated protein 14 n=1 Tax=Riccia fluitans TaxID=41844 RepID=A0ABD1XM30_9MARC